MTIMFLSHTAPVVGRSAGHAACASNRSSPATTIKQILHKPGAGELSAFRNERSSCQHATLVKYMLTCNY